MVAPFTVVRAWPNGHETAATHILKNIETSGRKSRRKNAPNSFRDGIGARALSGARWNAKRNTIKIAIKSWR